MREYIIYVILVFLPIGAIMTYLLQREGVSRRNIIIVVIISWLIIITFPLSIAKMGTFIGLLTYIAAILVMTRYLLGNKKEYVIESKGTLVTGNEYEQLMVNLERQGYDISTEPSGNFVSLGDEQAIKDLIAQQAAEMGFAEVSEPAGQLAEKDDIEIPIEEIIVETGESDINKPDIFEQLEIRASKEIADQTDDMDAVDEEQKPEYFANEDAAGDTADQATGEWLTGPPKEEPGLTGVIPSDTADLQDMDIPDKAAADKLASEAREDSHFQETVKVIAELELLKEPETTPVAAGEEPQPEEDLEASLEKKAAETSDEPEKETEQAVAIVLEEIAGEAAAESLEAGETAKAEPLEQLRPSVVEVLETASLDVFTKENKNQLESDDGVKALETTVEIVEEFDQGEAIASELSENASIEVEQAAELLQNEDNQKADDITEAETEKVEKLAEVIIEELDEIISEARQTPAIQDLQKTPVEALPIMEAGSLENEVQAAASLDLVEMEIEEALENDNDPGLEGVSSEPAVEFAETEPAATILTDDLAAETEELPEAEPETVEIAEESGVEDEPEAVEITEEYDVEDEKAAPSREPEEPIAIETEYSVEPEESPDLEESLAAQAEQVELEIAEESADATETAVESEPLTDHTRVPDPLLFELIDRGFALKEMGNWQEAVQCFMDADALTEEIELKELLNMEIVAIFRLLS